MQRVTTWIKRSGHLERAYVGLDTVVRLLGDRRRCDHSACHGHFGYSPIELEPTCSGLVAGKYVFVLLGEFSKEFLDRRVIVDNNPL